MPRASIAARWESWLKAGSPQQLASPLSPVTFPATHLRCLVEIAPGADLTADPATWSWVDITQWVRHDLGISTVVGRRDQAGTVDPSRATLKLDNRDGRFSRRNPTGPYYGQLTHNTPIRMAVDPGDGMHYRYHGFIVEWPKRWDKSGNDSTVTIACGGILRRLARSQPLRSALYRSMSGVTEADYTPHAYWPMEDGSDAVTFAAATANTLPATTSLYVGSTDPVVFAGNSSIPGSAPVASLPQGSVVNFTVPAYTDTGTWAVQVAIHEDEATTQLSFNIRSVPDNVSLTVLVYPTSGFFLTGAVNILTGATIFSTSVALTTADVVGVPASLIVGSNGDAGGTTVARLLDGDGNTIASTTDTGTGISMMPRTLSAQSVTPSGGSVGIGHVAMFTSTSFDIATDGVEGARATGGWAGEMAHERVLRLCREEGVSAFSVAGESAALGPQPIGTILDVLRDAERADQGVLYEREFGVAYKALSEYYGEPVQLALDFDSRHVADPPEADDSDLRFRNRWTVTRTNGSSATVLDEDYNTADGINPGSTTVNVEADWQAQHVAGWLVHRDTVDGDYWTGLKLRFHGTPDIIQAWTSLPYGARMTIANPPSQADPGSIDAIVEGWSERWDQVSWEATLNTGPASIYQVAVADESRIDSDSSTLTADITDSATSFSVTTSDPLDLWTTDTDEVPFDIIVGGEIMTVSAVASPVEDTFTRVTASGWGTADTGQSWSTSGGAAADYATSGTRGQHSVSAVASTRSTHIDADSTDVDVVVEIRPGAVATGAGIMTVVSARLSNQSNYLRWDLTFETTGLISARLRMVVGGSFTNYDTVTLPFSYDATSVVYARFKVHGDEMRGKAWPSTVAEPIGWNAMEESGATGSVTGTNVGVRSFLNSGNTNALPVVIEYDAFEVVNPQTFTVTRSVNGITKEHSAGAEVHVADPAIAAL